MGIIRLVRNVIIFLMSYISFFQFLFNVDTVDELIKGRILWFVDKKYNGIIISGVLIAIWCICSIIIYFQDNSNQEKSGKAFHEMQHQLRNVLFDLRKENSEIEKQGMNISYTIYYSQICLKAQLICDEVSSFFDSNFGKKFNICIKMIDVSSSRTTSSISQMRITTLCRSGCDKIERSKFDTTEKIFVHQNSDFESILDKDGAKGSNTVFTANNLRLYCFLHRILGTPYKTSSTNFLKKYNSTIVVPIRINAKKLPTNSDFSHMNQYQVFGFLCIDYKHRISKRLMMNILEYSKAFGDLLYIFFNEVLVGDNIIRRKQNASKKS